MTDYVGKQLGSYRIVRLLGRGGFADVYLGEHIFLKTTVAVKVLQARVTAQDDLDSFLNEAQTVARLMHPNIVRVMDFGVTEDTPFLVMDYAPGGTLRQRHPRGTQLAPATLIPYVKQVADALHYAHSEKLIHRDIKPENILIGRRGEILLSDFGIALISQSSRYQGTQDVTGTVGYMSPEQIQGKPVRASDQYSLGITIYEWLCGTRPFHGSFTELCVQHMFAPPPPLREKVSTISPEVEHVVMTALAKDAKQRFGSVQAFANALAQAAGVTEQHRPQPALLPPEPSIDAPAPTAESVQKPIIPPPPPMERAVIPPPPPTLPVTHLPAAFSKTEQAPSFTATELVTNGSGAQNTPPAQPVRVPPTAPDLPWFPAEPQPAVTPPIPAKSPATSPAKPFNAWQIGRAQIIPMVVGIILYSATYNLSIPSTSATFTYFFPNLLVSLFLGAVFGPWVGLATGSIGSIIGNVIFFHSFDLSSWYVYLGEGSSGFITGLITLNTKGHYRTIRPAIFAGIIGAVGVAIGLSIGDTNIVMSNGGNIVAFILANAIPSLILLPIFLLIYDRIAHRTR